jgi:hypothetical protein
MKSECHFYLDRAAKCLDMAEHVDKQYRGDLIQIARGWVRLAQEEFVEEFVAEQPPAADGPRAAPFRDELAFAKIA